MVAFFISAVALAVAIAGILIAAAGAITIVATPVKAAREGATFPEWLDETIIGATIGAIVFWFGVLMVYTGAMFLP